MSIYAAPKQIPLYRPDPQREARIAELMYRRSATEAQSRAAYGQIWRDTIAGMANAAAGYFGQRAQEQAAQKEEERKQEAMSKRATSVANTLGGWNGEDPNELLQGLVRVMGPQEGVAMAQGVLSFQELKRQQIAKERQEGLAQDEAFRQEEARNVEGVARGFYAAMNESPALGAQFYRGSVDSVRQALVGSMGYKPEDAMRMLPDNPTPEALASMAKVLRSGGGLGPKTETVKEGEGQFDPLTGQATVPLPKERKQPTLEEAYAAAIASGDTAEAQRLLRARGSFQAAGRAPEKPEAGQIIETANGPMIVDKVTGQARPITTGGEPVKGKAGVSGSGGGAAAGMDAVVDQIDELSKRINVSSGVSAVFGGKVRRAKAGTNYDDDVSQYESLVKGFTPMVARAVGHTGVLTEQDVQSVRALFPRPEDSASVRDRKIAQIRSIMAKMREAQGAMPQQQPEQDSYEAAGYKVKVK